MGRFLALAYRYTTFIGDGDSSAFNAVCALNDGAEPYTVPVVKEECLNHVSKRLGTRLRNLKRDMRQPVKTKTGKSILRSRLGGQKGLTDANIDRLAKHYGQNIRSQAADGTPQSLQVYSGHVPPCSQLRCTPHAHRLSSRVDILVLGEVSRGVWHGT